MSKTFTKIVSVFLCIILAISSLAVAGIALAEPSGDIVSSQSSVDELSPAAKEALAAKELGEKVATFQNTYQGIDPSSDEFKANVENLSNVLSDDDQAERVPWYSEKGEWVLAGVAKDKSGNTIVLWRCEGDSTKNDDMPILAFAHATYDDGKFIKVSHMSTQQGTASVSSSGERDTLGALVGDIKSKTEGIDTTNNISDSDYVDIASARETMKQSADSGE